MSKKGDFQPLKQKERKSDNEVLSVMNVATISQIRRTIEALADEEVKKDPAAKMEIDEKEGKDERGIIKVENKQPLPRRFRKLKQRARVPLSELSQSLANMQSSGKRRWEGINNNQQEGKQKNS